MKNILKRIAAAFTAVVMTVITGESFAGNISFAADDATGGDSAFYITSDTRTITESDDSPYEEHRVTFTLSNPPEGLAAIRFQLEYSGLDFQGPSDGYIYNMEAPEFDVANGYKNADNDLATFTFAANVNENYVPGETCTFSIMYRIEEGQDITNGANFSLAVSDIELSAENIDFEDSEDDPYVSEDFTCNNMNDDYYTVIEVADSHRKSSSNANTMNIKLSSINVKSDDAGTTKQFPIFISNNFNSIYSISLVIDYDSRLELTNYGDMSYYGNLTALSKPYIVNSENKNQAVFMLSTFDTSTLQTKDVVRVSEFTLMNLKFTIPDDATDGDSYAISVSSAQIKAGDETAMYDYYTNTTQSINGSNKATGFYVTDQVIATTATTKSAAKATSASSAKSNSKNNNNNSGGNSSGSGGGNSNSGGNSSSGGKSTTAKSGNGKTQKTTAATTKSNSKDTNINVALKSAKENHLTIETKTVSTSRAGGEVTVYIYCKKPTGMGTCGFRISYDPRLTYVGFVANKNSDEAKDGIIDNPTVRTSKNTIVLTTVVSNTKDALSPSNRKTENPLYKITFRLPKNAADKSFYYVKWDFVNKWLPQRLSSSGEITFPTKSSALDLTNGGIHVDANAIDFPMLGDANLDNTVDSKDAAMILTDYAQFMLDNSYYYSYKTKLEINADVNFDNMVDSIDAANILKYYAELMLDPTIYENGTKMEDYMRDETDVPDEQIVWPPEGNSLKVQWAKD